MVLVVTDCDGNERIVSYEDMRADDEDIDMSEITAAGKKELLELLREDEEMERTKSTTTPGPF